MVHTRLAHLLDVVENIGAEVHQLTEMTQVKSEETCPICNMPRMVGCSRGTVGLNPETKDIQTDPYGPKGSHIMCPQKKEWRDALEPLPLVSGVKKPLPPIKKPISRACDAENPADLGTESESQG